MTNKYGMPRYDTGGSTYADGSPISPMHDFYANEFACALLMPVEEFVGLYNDPHLSINDIARHFEVEVEVAEYWKGRLIKTGDITPDMIQFRDLIVGVFRSSL